MPKKTPGKSSNTSSATSNTKELAPCDGIQQAQKWIIEGNSLHDILEHLCVEHPTLDAEKTVAAALDMVREQAEADPVLIRGWCLEATRELYRKMVEIGDFVGALRAVQQLDKMGKAQTPKGTKQPPKAITLEDL